MFQFQSNLIMYFKIISILCKQRVILFLYFVCISSNFGSGRGWQHCVVLHPCIPEKRNSLLSKSGIMV